ncbi:uncharacterized protein LOC133173429 [Saccostrea echinata]|uniref:uncharacterized protein LOC133173429 n=1 Tax=Saccostrea echinata TaxID=191078 RepID=UPI002A804EE3|nr:uncharacterized protein LOC133173429 [Saccostrea echinata]
MGTRVGKGDPGVIAHSKVSEMDNKELWSVAEKLHQQIMSHDRAVQQMYLLDSKLHDLEHRLSLLSGSVRPQLKQHWYVRTGMVEWIRDMYDEYRLRKWTDIQLLINFIFQTYNSEEVMTILILADVTSQSIGIFMENEEGDTSDSDGSHFGEDMMLEESSEGIQDLHISGAEEEMQETS